MVRLCGKRPLLVSRLCLCLCLWLPCCVCISLWILPAVDAFALSSSSSSPLTAALLRRSSRQRQHRTGGDAPCPGTRGLHLESPALTPPSSSCLHSTAASVSALPSSPMENKGSLFREGPPLRAWQSKLVRTALMLYVAGMCVALPLTLYPQKLLYKLGLISKRRKEIMALSTARFCARWMLRFVPFCRLEAVPCERSPSPPEPSIWVCNHVSMLDVFVLLGVDRRLRGRVKRPIKIVYWKGLEANPVTALLFKQAGFIPVQMADNGNGNDNEYDVSSFKKLLKDAKGRSIMPVGSRGERLVVVVSSHPACVVIFTPIPPPGGPPQRPLRMDLTLVSCLRDSSIRTPNRACCLSSPARTR